MDEEKLRLIAAEKGWRLRRVIRRKYKDTVILDNDKKGLTLTLYLKCKLEDTTESDWRDWLL